MGGVLIRNVAIVRATRMGSVRFRAHKMRRRPWPSAACVRPASVPARTPRGTRTPTRTGRRIAWPSLSSPPALTRRTPTKRSALRLRGGRRTPLVAYAPSLSWAPPLSTCSRCRVPFTRRPVSSTWATGAATSAPRIAVTGASKRAAARTGPRQREDHALIGGLDQGAGDAASTRLSTGLAPAGLALRTWWWLLERRVRGWWPAGVVAILSQTCFEFLNALMHLLNGRSLPLNDRSLLRHPFIRRMD